MSNLPRPSQNLNEQHVQHEQMNMSKGCERVIHHKSEVSLPVSIQPYVLTGAVETKCCGEPHIIKKESKNICHFIITQEICIDIPVKFGAKTEISDSHIECDGISVDNCD